MTDTRYSGVPRTRSTSADRRLGHYDLRDEPSVPLSPTHPAMTGASTRFPTSVVTPDAEPALLKPGQYQRKIGARIRYGPWAGLPIWTLTLIERATCPKHCAVWSTCYGNNMHWAHRIDPRHPAFLPKLSGELEALDAKGPFAVRLHILGDFWSEGYASWWHGMLDRLEGLHIFGFTAHPHPDRPAAGASIESAEIGWWVYHMNMVYPDRCAIRFSGAPGDMAAAVVSAPDFLARSWDAAAAFGCPAQAGSTDGCDTCGLCWHPSHRHKTVMFADHGRPRQGRKAA